MADFDSNQIRDIYIRTLADAKVRLSQIEVFCGQQASFAGLNGWVFEQTIQFCLKKELAACGIERQFKEQHALRGKAKVDLVIGHLAIEIKAGGIFANTEANRYFRYKTFAQEQGLSYLYLTQTESHLPFRDSMISVLGAENTFFLDRSDDWARFVERVRAELLR